MADYIEVEVEENENSYAMPQRLFSARAQKRLVSQVRMDTRQGRDVLCWVVGWSSEAGGTPCAAYSVAVEDSGSAVSYLVFGGDWGIRFKPVGLEEAWSITSNYQFGEPCLLLGEDPVDAEGHRQDVGG
jgi:hypothetical protein